MQIHFPFKYNMLSCFLLFLYFRLVQQSEWSSQCELEQAAEPLPVEFSEELPLVENAVDRSHVRPQLTNSIGSSSEDEEEEENVSRKEQHESSLVSMFSSELVQDGSCLAE